MCVQPRDNGELEGAQTVSDHYLVELSAITPSGQDLIENDMRIFAEQLKPYPQITGGHHVICLFCTKGGERGDHFCGSMNRWRSLMGITHAEA